MHIAVSWDITDGQMPPRGDIEKQMLAVLQSYSWIRPLTTYYIVRTEVIGRQAIYDGLLKVGQAYPTRVKFLVSPLMQGGYMGFVTGSDWPAINERTS